jgi:hypothetical protein
MCKKTYKVKFIEIIIIFNLFKYSMSIKFFSTYIYLNYVLNISLFYSIYFLKNAFVAS